MRPDADLHQDKAQFGSKTITYSVERSNRNTLGISVNPDASIKVVAPYDASLVLIREKVLKRADWIIKQQLDFIENEKPKIKFNYTSGESHWYLGKQYRLKFAESDDIGVSRENRYLVIRGPRDADQVKTLLTNWYREQAKEKIGNLIETWWSRREETRPMPSFSIRKLEKRWGSCTAKGQLIFNDDLIKTPSQCIEYVVVHELCHLFEHNHGPKFVSMLTRHLPDWEERKRRLEKIEI